MHGASGGNRFTARTRNSVDTSQNVAMEANELRDGQADISVRALDQIPRFAAVASLAMLCVSVFHDWSYLLALGLSFAEVSSTLQDHLRSALIWAPATIAGLVLGGMLVFAGLSESKNAQRLSRWATWALWAALGIGVIIAVLESWWLLIYCAFAAGWMWVAKASLAHEPFRLSLFGPKPRFAPLFIYIVLPFLTHHHRRHRARQSDLGDAAPQSAVGACGQSGR
jgi:hypothetical protein